MPTVAVNLSLRQEKLYEASADVLVTRLDLAATLSGIPALYEDPTRFIQTQIDLTRIPDVARRALDAAGLPERSASDFLGNSSVSAKSGSDLLTFEVTDPDPKVAAALATAYAREFTLYRHQLDTSSVKRAREEVAARIAEFEQPPDRDSALYDSYASLVERREQLRTMEALQTQNATLVRTAGGAAQVQPRPVRNGILGLGLGLVFGIGLAFLLHALDTRVRSTEEIAARLAMPLLGRLPGPSRRVRKQKGITMLAEPRGPLAESFRLLRTNVEFANLERKARTIMFTSAVQGEGKSTTVANLAVAFARAGRRVAVVDLDLRRPALDDFFQLDGGPGVTDVALGNASLAEAVVPVTVAELEPGGRVEGNGYRPAVEKGLLEVLPCGSLPPAPSEFMVTDALAGILALLRARVDLVLIDVPPLLHVGDAIALSSRVDALVLVTRLNAVDRRTLAEVRRVLDACPATPLGFVLTGGAKDESYGSYYYEYRPAKKRAASEPAAR